MDFYFQTYYSIVVVVGFCCCCRCCVPSLSFVLIAIVRDFLPIFFYSLLFYYLLLPSTQSELVYKRYQLLGKTSFSNDNQNCGRVFFFFFYFVLFFPDFCPLFTTNISLILSPGFFLVSKILFRFLRFPSFFLVCFAMLWGRVVDT